MNKTHSQPVRRLKKRMTRQNVELQSHMCQTHIEEAVSNPFLVCGIVFVAIFIHSYLSINLERGHDSQLVSFLSQSFK